MTPKKKWVLAMALSSPGFMDYCMCCHAEGSAHPLGELSIHAEATHLAGPLQLHFLTWNLDLKASRSGVFQGAKYFNQETGISDSIFCVFGYSFKEN